MTLLPLIERELRARARSRVTYWTRFAAVAVGMMVCLPELLSGEFGAATGNGGKFTFNGIVVIGFLLACCGSLLTADVLSRERREGTLGLLLLTHLRRLDVLFGKFSSAGLTSICVLAALLPLMMLPVLAGGVTGGEAFRKGLALLNTLFLALAAGLWASAAAKEQARAVGSAVRVLAALILVPMVLTIFKPLPIWLIGPISTLFVADDQSYKNSAAPYWISLALVHLIAWTHLIVASRRLRTPIWDTEEKMSTRFAYDEYIKSLKRRWPLSWTGKPQQPVEFLAQRQRGIKATLWAAVVIGVLLQWGALFVLVVPFGIWTLLRWLPLSMLSGALLAWAMTRFMIESRRSGTLELLMTTPIGAKTIVSGQWNSLKQLLRWPVVVLLFPYLLQIVMVGSRVGSAWQIDQITRQWAYIFFGMANTFFGIGALCWTALWFGYKIHNQAGAIVWTVGIAKGVPFFIYLVSRSLFAAGFFSAGLMTPYDVRWVIPQFLTLLFYVRLMLWVKARFLEEFPGSEPLRFTLLQLVSQGNSQTKMAFQTPRN
jgi:ABC-type transport system involved in multi-copper enzyme maturation permease subunit